MKLFQKCFVWLPPGFTPICT